MYNKWTNSSIWPIDVTRTHTTILGQSGQECNSKEEVLHLPESSRTGASPSDGLLSYQDHSLGRVLPLSRNAVGVFYSPQPTGLTRNKNKNTCKNITCPIFVSFKNVSTSVCIKSYASSWSGYFL